MPANYNNSAWFYDTLSRIVYGRAVINAQIYLFGGATSLFEISTNSGGVGQTYVQPATSGALSGTIKKLAITIDSVTYYIPCATAVA